MTRRRQITLIIVAAVSLAGIAFWLLRPREPEYQGRPLSAWLEDLTTGRDGVQLERARQAIQEIGTNAVPELLILIQKEDSKLRMLWNGILMGVGFESGTQQALYSNQDLATLGFAVLSRRAYGALPTLEVLQTNSSPSVSAAATEAIRLISAKPGKVAP
jgi:hypothetical protein